MVEFSARSSMVRARSLYLRGFWFESKRAEMKGKQHLRAVFRYISEAEACFASTQNGRDLLKAQRNIDLWIKDMAVEVAKEFSCDDRKCFFVWSLVGTELCKQFLVKRMMLLQTPRDLEQNLSNVAVAPL